MLCHPSATLANGNAYVRVAVVKSFSSQEAVSHGAKSTTTSLPTTYIPLPTEEEF